MPTRCRTCRTCPPGDSRLGGPAASGSVERSSGGFRLVKKRLGDLAPGAPGSQEAQIELARARRDVERLVASARIGDQTLYIECDAEGRAHVGLHGTAAFLPPRLI